MPTASEMIERLALVPHDPEGGFYRETWRSPITVSTEFGPRSAGTTIYYLLTPDSKSRLHRLRFDETFYFNAGDSISQVLLHEGGRCERRVLGPRFEAGHIQQSLVPANVWQGAQLEADGEWALLSTSMAPGFDYADFEAADRQLLLQLYPGEAELVEALTLSASRA